MTLRLLAILGVAFLLSGCYSSSGGPSATATPPAPSSTPGPSTVALAPPRRGRQVFAADFTGPDLGCFMEITGDVPPVDTTPPHAIWGVTDYHNGTTDPLCQPGPNARYRCENGRLHLSAKDEASAGFQLITKKTFSRKGCTSFQGDFTCTALNTPADAYAGLVSYNGDFEGTWVPDVKEMTQRMWDTGEWWSIYFSFRDGDLMASIWSASTVEEATRVKLRLAPTYTFRIDHDHPAGKVDFYVIDRGVVILHLTSSLTAPLNRDPVLFSADPHLDLAIGAADMAIENLTVFSDAVEA